MSTIARAVLTSGTAHPDVYELGRLLAAAGYENSVSEGRNPFGICDESILQAVNQLRSDHDVAEDDTIPQVPHEQRRNWVGPNVWDALLTDRGNPRKLTKS